jgi:hypothetical protein
MPLANGNSNLSILYTYFKSHRVAHVVTGGFLNGKISKLGFLSSHQKCFLKDYAHDQVKIADNYLSKLF